MSTINSKEINDKIASLHLRKDLSKEQQRQEDIAAINDYALRNPTRVFDKDFTKQRQYLTEKTWKAVIQANQDMQDSASPKWRHIHNADIVNKYQGQAFSDEVRKAINEDGVKLAGLAAAVPGAIIGGTVAGVPMLQQMVYHPGTFFAETVGGTLGGYVGGEITDAATRALSDYSSFGNMIASNSTIPEEYAGLLNPGMLLGGVAGGVGGNVLYNSLVKPAVQKAALPYLISRQLNKNIDNTVLPLQKTVRLYRGTGTNGQISLDGGVEQAGQWFTPLKTKTGSYLSNQQAYAKRKGINNPTFLEYVDIPESQLEYYRAKRILDPKKVEFESNEDYLIPLHIKRNKIEIPHFTNSQERLDLHLGKSLPETPFNPSNTQWDISKHIYYNEDPTKTSGLFLDFIDHSDEFISAKALNKLTKDNNYYFRQETYLDPIENIDILQNNKTNKQLLFKDGSMFNYQFPNDKQVLYRIPKQNIQLKEISQKPGIYYYDQESINMNDVKGDILEWDDVAKMYKITQYRKLGGKLNYLDLFKNNFQK